ncbi:Syntaxin-6 [Camelus dromedarius]|uniref:Syntaxin-6 n=1 Tax=Camelus dromedarius TaxID=9838 RepID=A0A5N4CPU4_CAMDR|nr:Syntaxin-6 [Camelus dromedarius]
MERVVCGFSPFPSPDYREEVELQCPCPLERRLRHEVEANPRKFNLDATELSIRKAFITSTRQVVRALRVDSILLHSAEQYLYPKLSGFHMEEALLGDSGGQNWSTGTTDKYGRLDRELQLANSHFIEEQQAQQQLIVEQQDEQLELVSGSIGVLKNMSQRIGGELEEQAVMLDDFSHELESTQSRLDNVMKKLAKVSHMTSGEESLLGGPPYGAPFVSPDFLSLCDGCSPGRKPLFSAVADEKVAGDRRQWCAITVLFVVLLVVLILFLVL